MQLTRKERQNNATEKRTDRKDRWLEKLQSLVRSGITYKEAVHKVAITVADSIANSPSKAAEIRLAWKELHTWIAKECERVEKEQKK